MEIIPHVSLQNLLGNVTFTLVVGRRGSGKSQLVRYLCSLYTDRGIPVRSYVSFSDLHNLCVDKLRRADTRRVVVVITDHSRDAPESPWWNVYDRACKAGIDVIVATRQTDFLGRLAQRADLVVFRPEAEKRNILRLHSILHQKANRRTKDDFLVKMRGVSGKQGNLVCNRRDGIYTQIAAEQITGHWMCVTLLRLYYLQQCDRATFANDTCWFMHMPEYVVKYVLTYLRT